MVTQLFHASTAATADKVEVSFCSQAIPSRTASSTLAILPMPSGLGTSFTRVLAQFCWLCWYRPPEQGEVDTIHTLLTEWREHQQQVVGTIVMGDMNVHHSQWLRFSSQGVSKESRVLLDTCNRIGLQEKLENRLVATTCWILS